MSEYRIRRQTCRGIDYAEVRLEISTSQVGGVFYSNVPQHVFPDGRYLACIEKGVWAAFDSLNKDRQNYSVQLISATDLSGESAPASFQFCAEGAVCVYFGREDVAPSRGYNVEP